MQVPHSEGAMRAAPRGVGRSVGRGACGPAIELRNIRRPGCRRSPCSGRPYGEVRQREYPAGSASSETLARTPRSVHGNREISRLAARHRAARIGKAGGPKPMMHGREKSDPAIVAGKSANKGGRRRRSRWSQELAPGLNRGAGAEGNTVERGTRRTPGRGSVSPRAGPCTASGQGEKEGEVHGAPPSRRCRPVAVCLQALQREAAAGVDGVR